MAKKIVNRHLAASSLIDSRIPKRFWTLGVDTYPGAESALKAVQHYTNELIRIRDSSTGLRLFGPTASCKTFLAVNAMRECLLTGFSVSYFTLTDLTDMFFKRLDDNAASFRTRVFSPDLVCFDDVNMPANAGSKMALLQAIRLRSDEAKPYIICTRLTDDLLTEYYGIVSDLQIQSATVFVDGDLLNFFNRDLVTVSTSANAFEIDTLHKKARARFEFKGE